MAINSDYRPELKTIPETTDKAIFKMPMHGLINCLFNMQQDLMKPVPQPLELRSITKMFQLKQ